MVQQIAENGAPKKQNRVAWSRGEATRPSGAILLMTELAASCYIKISPSVVYEVKESEYIISWTLNAIPKIPLSLF